MFYCEQCAEKNYYPVSILKSNGKCEICGATAVCNDVPSSQLPQGQKEDKRKLVTVRTIADIVPIENADNIELAKIDGWQCVVKKGEFKKGDYCLYFEVDSLLPDIPEYAFLKKGSTLKRVTIDGEVKVGIRLKTIKLRGQLSQGLALPTTMFAGIIPDAVIENGSDVSLYLGVVKYEPPIPAQLAGKVKGFFPSFIPKTDEERIQNMAGVLTGFYVTEKLDGSSVTYFKKNGELRVCSRNLELLETEGNTQWRVARELDLQNKIPEGMAIQGELVGEGIQKNPLKIAGQHVYFFNAINFETNKYLDFERFKQFFAGLGLDTVPIIDENFSLPKTVDELLSYAEGKSALAPTEREGVVIRPKNEMIFNGQRLSFKVISNKYLMEEGD